MRYEIELAAEAIDDFKQLKANEPTKVSKSRIKRLRGVSKPQYRLRVDDIRVFYDVSGRKVEVLAIVAKAQADAWLSKAGERS
jgi:mRNA-degrading endonuclease RelE of RelBE toxin-antitoxin system